MTPLRLLLEAEEEVDAAAAFYEGEEQGLGLAFLQEVRRAFDFVRRNPLASRIERDDVRVRSISRFPYRLYYRATSTEIVVFAIGHRRRRPGFWRSRE